MGAPESRREARLLLGQEARDALASGVGALAELIARTLGPAAGGVVASREARGPEVIRSGGVLARRIIAGEDRSLTVGMMLLRHGVWRVHETVGDGGAITAALIHSLASGGLRLLTGGVGAADLRRGLERALPPVVAALQGQARPLMSARSYLPDLLKTAVADRELGRVLGELFAEVGPEVAIDVEEYAGWHAAYRVVPGCRLHGRLLFPGEPATPERELTEPYVLATTIPLSEPREVIPLIENILGEAGGPLVVVAPKASDKVLAILKQYRDKNLLETFVWLPSGPDPTDDILDLAMVVGARALDGGPRRSPKRRPRAGSRVFSVRPHPSRMDGARSRSGGPLRTGAPSVASEGAADGHPGRPGTPAALAPCWRDSRTFRRSRDRR